MVCASVKVFADLRLCECPSCKEKIFEQFGLTGEARIADDQSTGDFARQVSVLTRHRAHEDAHTDSPKYLVENHDQQRRRTGNGTGVNKHNGFDVADPVRNVTRDAVQVASLRRSGDAAMMFLTICKNAIFGLALRIRGDAAFAKTSRPTAPKQVR